MGASSTDFMQVSRSCLGGMEQARAARRAGRAERLVRRLSSRGIWDVLASNCLFSENCLSRLDDNSPLRTPELGI